MSKEVIKNGEGIIPEGTKAISAETFADCTDLTRIVIPDSVTEIGDFAFSGCTNLASIKIPNSVISIDNYAFHNCGGLTGKCIMLVYGWCMVGVALHY